MTRNDPPRLISEDGRHGQMLRQVQTADGTRSVVVAWDNGEQVILPVAFLSQQPDGNYRVSLGQESLTQVARTEAGETDIVPVIAEELRVGKRTVETGRVRVQKVVHEREEVVDEPLLREDIQVERVAVNQPITAAPEVRYEGDTLIVPVVEEILVVEKRLILKEELHITRRQATVHDPQMVTLRREDVIIEHLPPEEDAVRHPELTVSKTDSPQRNP